MNRPLLLIDVDGVISLFGFDPASRPPGRFEVVDGIAHFLSATAGEHLRRLVEVYEPAWCTGWEEKANEYLPHALGLPGPFAHLSFADATPLVAGHWKLAAIDRYAGPDRPLAWIDDAHDERCREWAAARRGPTLLLGTDPATGLTDEHVERLLVWAEGPELNGEDAELNGDDREHRRQARGHR
jgi:HAD domain in Swiss Army Knife RNA repair proteins